MTNDDLFDRLENQMRDRQIGFSTGSQNEGKKKMGIFKTSAMVSAGIFGMAVMLMMRVVAAFVSPFAILAIGRLIYCQVTDTTFDIWWPVRGAFFLAVLFAIATLINIAASMASSAENSLRKIPAEMVSFGFGVFALQFVWHGFHCFFSDDKFLILDKAWLGDMLTGLIVAVVVAIWGILKYLFARK